MNKAAGFYCHKSEATFTELTDSVQKRLILQHRTWNDEKTEKERTEANLYSTEIVKQIRGDRRKRNMQQRMIKKGKAMPSDFGLQLHCDHQTIIVIIVKINVTTDRIISAHCRRLLQINDH